MIEIIKTALQIQDICQEYQWKFCIIGGLANLRWGEPRTTQDVDITLLTGFGGEERHIEILLKKFKSRIADAAKFALQRRVLLLQSTTGIGIDIALAGLPFEKSAIHRASLGEFEEGVKLRTCSAEALIVFKAFADRPRDWIDVEGILIRQSNLLDWRYITNQLQPLIDLKEAPHIMKRLKKLRENCK